MKMLNSLIAGAIAALISISFAIFALIPRFAERSSCLQPTPRSIFETRRAGLA